MEKRKWIAQIVLVLLVLLTLESLGVFLPPPLNIGIQTVEATPDPVTVGTTTSLNAIASSFMRKSFFANTRHWVFYSDGTNIVYRTTNKTDLSTWSDATTIRASPYGYGWTVWFDDTYIHYAYSDDSSSGNPILYRRGTPNSDGTITWTTDEHTALSGEAGVRYEKPFISVDSGGYPWIGYARGLYPNLNPYITKSQWNNGSWSTATGFPYQLSTTLWTEWFVSPIPLTSNKVYTIYSAYQQKIRGRLWNSTGWEAEENATIGNRYYFSAVNQGDDVHLVYLEYASYDILYVKRTYGSGWGSEVTVQPSTLGSQAPVLTINASSNDLYCFWAGSPESNHIYYKKYNGTAWDSDRTDWIDQTSETLVGASNIMGFYKSYESKIGLTYLTNAGGSIYNVKYVAVSSASIGNFCSFPVTIYPDSYFYLNATIVNEKGLNDFVNATVQITNSIVLKWIASTNTFAEESDPSGYCTLDASGSIRTQTSSTSYRLSWRIKLSSSYPTIGPVSVITTNTKVFDSDGLFGANSCPQAFYFDPHPEPSGNPSTVGHTSVYSQTARCHQRKVFFAKNQIWVFYSDGTNLVYRTSADGLSWSDPTLFKVGGSSSYVLSLAFNGTHFAYAYAPEAGTTLYYRLGQANSDGTITWSTSYEQRPGSSYTYDVAICFDTQGYPYIAYTTYDGGNYYPKVLKSSERNGIWVTASGFPFSLNTTISSSSWRVSILPLTSGKVYALYTDPSRPIFGRLWDGSSWGSEETASSSNIEAGAYHSAVNEGDHVHLVFLKDVSYDIIYVKRTYGTGWGSEVTVQSSVSSKSAPGLSIRTTNNDLYCFWMGSPTANHIYYKRSRSGTWDTDPTDWVDESSEPLYDNNLHTSYYESKDWVGLIYTTKSSAPHNIRHAFLSFAPTIGQFSTSSYTVYADTDFYLNATIPDVDGLNDFVNATLEINNSVILKWENSTNTFSIQSDPNSYCTLDASGSSRTQINSTAYELSWKIKLSSSYPVGGKSIVATNTKVFDSGGLSGSNSYSSLFYFEGSQPSNLALPSIIGTTTTWQGTVQPPQRKILFANGRFWAWYSDGARLVYKTSTDGLSWSEATNVDPMPYGTRFSIDFDDTYFHIAFRVGDSLYYRRGTPNSDGTITWSTSKQTVYSGTGSDFYTHLHISVDSEGYPWIGALHYDGTNYYPYVFKSSLNNGSWQTQSGFPYQLSNSISSDGWMVSVHRLTNSKIYVIYGCKYRKILGKLWNGTSWESEETASTSQLAFAGYYRSSVAVGDTIHLTFVSNTTAVNPKYNILYVRRVYGTGWENEITLRSEGGMPNVPILSIDPVNNILYCFLGDSYASNHLYYKRNVGGNWDSEWTDWIDETSECITHFLTTTSSYRIYNNKVVIMYETKIGGSYYNVKFSGLSVYYEKYLVEAPLDLTVSSLKYDSATSQLTFTASATGTRSIKVKADKCYYVKINDVVYVEGQKWTYDPTHGVITITDTFSTKNIVVSWASLAPPEPPPPPPPSGEGPPTAPEWAKPIVEEVIKPMVLAIPKFYVGLFIIGLILVGASLAHSYDDETITALCIIVMVVIAVDLLFVWVLKPVGLMPADLRFLEPLLWEPPTLSLEVFGLPSEQTLIVQGVLMISLIVMFVVAVVLVAGEE